MKKSYVKVLCLYVFVINIVLLSIFIIKIKTNSLNYFFLWYIIDAILIMIIGHEKDKSLYRIDILQTVFIYSFIYFILVWSMGLFLGFTYNNYNLSLINIISNTIYLIGTIILQEIFRYHIVKKCSDSKNMIVIMIMILSNITICLNINNYNLNNPMEIFELVGIIIIPTILNNLLLTYITFKSGYIPSIVYRLILEVILVYIVPIFPNLGVYLESVFKIVFPTIIFLKLNKMFTIQTFLKIKRQAMTRKFLNLFMFIVAAFVVLLISGIFKYCTMSVGSNSMYPNIKKGDLIIIEKCNQYEDIHVGNILAYKYDGKIIFHRVIKIRNNENTYIFNTKGDNNSDKDAWDIHQEDVVGIVKFKVPYLGYPSVWLSEQF